MVSQATAVVLVVAIVAVCCAATVIVVSLAAIRGWASTRKHTTTPTQGTTNQSTASHPMFEQNRGS